MSASVGDNNHDFQPFEQNANRRAFMYFNENVEGFYKSYEDRYADRGWNFYRNPLDVDHIGRDSRWDYFDYYNSSDMNLVNSLSLNADFSDYLGWIIMPFCPYIGIPYVFLTGNRNGNYYLDHRIK